MSYLCRLSFKIVSMLLLDLTVTLNKTLQIKRINTDTNFFINGFIEHLVTVINVGIIII